MSWQDGFQESARRAQAIMEDLRQERDDALKECTRIAAERDAAKREAKGWQERAHECELRRAPEPKIAVGTGPVAAPNLRTEREFWHMDAERRDEDRVMIAGHEARWSEAARILGIDDDPKWNISGVLDAIRGVVRTADLAATLAAGTGPVAVPSTDPDPSDILSHAIEQAGLSGDLAGSLNVVARHSREIGTLQDECRALRERLARLERQVDPASDGKTATIPGTSAGLL